MTREGVARLVCYWMAVPPHASCHDNFCVTRCTAKQDPYDDQGPEGPLLRGLTDAILRLEKETRT